MSNYRRDMTTTERRLAQSHGMSLLEYKTIVAGQGGLCAICRKPCKRKYRNGKGRLSVDHDHKTGLFRGLLCGDCNNGLGYFHDSIDTLLAAASYLIQRSEQSVFA